MVTEVPIGRPRTSNKDAVGKTRKSHGRTFFGNRSRSMAPSQKMKTGGSSAIIVVLIPEYDFLAEPLGHLDNQETTNEATDGIEPRYSIPPV
jgi:hypothetical protein